MEDLFKTYCLRPPRLLQQLLPVSGTLKVEPEDFQVREIGDVTPSESGEHLHCWIEKRDLGTDELLTMLSRELRISRDSIGLAGMKDKRAVTFQWISLPSEVESRLGEVEFKGFSVHASVLHSAKLRRGQLSGNAFQIRIRAMNGDDRVRLELLWETIASCGVPNYFGAQRFGRDGNTLRLGLKLLKGEKVERNQFLRQLSLHSVQSAIFNVVVGKRVEQATFSAPLKGDSLINLKTHMPSICLNPKVDAAKVEEGRLGIMGPLIGPKCHQTKGEVALLEADALERFGLKLADFNKFSSLMPGQRRPFLLKPTKCEMHDVEGDPLLSFELPPGSYATVLMNEFLMCNGAGLGEEADT